MLKKRPIYVEIQIKGDLDTLWERTQNPFLHQQWDLRFSEITYLPKAELDDPQRFLYLTRIGFGVKISGIGESVATKTKDSGESISVLKFSSDHYLSLIRSGAGYWKYKPKDGEVQFITGYDYEVRWGIIGKVIDGLLFRPILTWATAWSFDCLRLWIEKGILPKQSLQSQLIVWLSSFTLSLIWLYQGLIPKLMFPDTGELVTLQQSGLFPGIESEILTFIGLGEMLFGVVMLFIQKATVHYLNLSALTLLTLGALFADKRIFILPFNPFSLNVSMIVLSIICLLLIHQIPKASYCKTRER